MQYGTRIIYDPMTGKVINNSLNEMEGSLEEGLRPESIEYIDLPFGYNENNFKSAAKYHIDITKNDTTSLSERIVIDAYWQIPE